MTTEMTDSTDTDKRFSLLELDTPRAPAPVSTPTTAYGIASAMSTDELAAELAPTVAPPELMALLARVRVATSADLTRGSKLAADCAARPEAERALLRGAWSDRQAALAHETRAAFEAGAAEIPHATQPKGVHLNRYPGKCAICEENVPARAGTARRSDGVDRRWLVYCARHTVADRVSPVSAPAAQAAPQVPTMQAYGRATLAAPMAPAAPVQTLALGPNASDAAPRTPATSNPLGLAESELRGAPQGRRGAYVVPAGVTRDERRAELAAAPSLHGINVVAGAVAEGHGVLVGWQGAGELTRSAITAVLASAGLPEQWAPSPKSPRAHAGKAVQDLNNSGYISRADKKSGKRTTRSGQHRWLVGRARLEGQVTEAFGQIAAIVTLTDDTLTIEGDEIVAYQVETEYRRTIGAEILQAGEVTQWLAAVMRYRLGAVRMGGIYYVPRRCAGAANQLCTEMGKIWGNGWIVPALPIATSAEVRAGLARGLAEEVAEIEATLTARDAEKALGPRGAAGYLGRLREVAARCKSYSDLLGAEHVTEIKAKADALLALISEKAHDTSLRGAMLEFD